MKENAPNRYQLYTLLPEQSRFRNDRLLPMLVGKYRMMAKMKDADPELYEFSVKQEKLRDDAFAILRQLHDTNAQGDPRANLRDKMRELVDVLLEERQSRIEKLERALAEQKAKLAQDQSTKEALIEQQTDRVVREAHEAFQRMDMIRRRFAEAAAAAASESNVNSNAPTTAPAPAPAANPK